MWISEEAIDAWKLQPSRRRGGQRRYSDVAIETALTMRLVFNLPLRQAEGFLRSLLDLMGLGLDVPDHTTLSRRCQPRDSCTIAPEPREAAELAFDKGWEVRYYPLRQRRRPESRRP